MVKILTIDPQPVRVIPYQCASSGKPGVTNAHLPIYLATVDRLPANLAALVVTSDLQGVDPDNKRLLGHRVAAELESIIEQRDCLPSSAQIGTILAGDFYAALERRGGIGDVRSIWQDFHRRFRWVAGVAGNHDSFGDCHADFEAFKQTTNIYFLDGTIERIDDLNIAGISGLISTKQKPFRHPPKIYRQLIRALLDRSPDILILHEGPSFAELKLRGNDTIRAELDKYPSVLTICGHCHWRQPLVDVPQGGQVLNVDGRAVILIPQATDSSNC